jgi:hypothetical protein
MGVGLVVLYTIPRLPPPYSSAYTSAYRLDLGHPVRS